MMKKKKYVAYNRLFFKGKSVGKRFKVLTAPTRALAKERVMEYNASWNKAKINRNWKAKLVAIV